MCDLEDKMLNVFYRPDEKCILYFYRDDVAILGDNEEYIAITKAIEIVNGQPKVGEWIPCSERLPEDPDENLYDLEEFPEYNVMIKYAKIATTLHYMGDGEWGDSYGYGYEVIAWMPLPEAYKEGE